jgi:hypothetical protein
MEKNFAAAIKVPWIWFTKGLKTKEEALLSVNPEI